MVDASSWYEYVLMLPDSIAVPENSKWNKWFIRVADIVRSSNDYLLRVADKSRSK